MTNAEIRAELIRSATEDEQPYEECANDVFWFARDWSECAIANQGSNFVRTFYLLVAEAIK